MVTKWTPILRKLEREGHTPKSATEKPWYTALKKRHQQDRFGVDCIEKLDPKPEMTLKQALRRSMIEIDPFFEVIDAPHEGFRYGRAKK